MQSIALVADLHSNTLSLEAILKDVRKKHKPDRIISLGDQINLGPAPRETLDMLRQENVVCLHGNHERYILSAMKHDPAYAGANFASLDFNIKQVTEEEITFQAGKDAIYPDDAYHRRAQSQSRALCAAQSDYRWHRQFRLHGRRHSRRCKLCHALPLPR